MIWTVCQDDLLFKLGFKIQDWTLGLHFLLVTGIEYFLLHDCPSFAFLPWSFGDARLLVLYNIYNRWQFYINIVGTNGLPAEFFLE